MSHRIINPKIITLKWNEDFHGYDIIVDKRVRGTIGKNVSKLSDQFTMLMNEFLTMNGVELT